MTTTDTVANVTPTEVWAFPGTMHTARDLAALTEHGIDPDTVGIRERSVQCMTFGCTNATGNVMGHCNIEGHYVAPGAVARARAALHGTNGTPAPASPRRRPSTMANVFGITPADVEVHVGAEQAWVWIGPMGLAATLHIDAGADATLADHLMAIEAFGAHIATLAANQLAHLEAVAS